MDFKGVRITWLGHSTFLIASPEGPTLLVDPFLANNPKCPRQFHEVASDAIAITHGHADHLADVFSAASRCSAIKSTPCASGLSTWNGSLSDSRAPWPMAGAWTTAITSA